MSTRCHASVAAVTATGALAACSSLLSIGELPGFPPDAGASDPAGADVSLGDGGGGTSDAPLLDVGDASSTPDSPRNGDGAASPDAGCDANLTVDPANCGTCGHGCQGGDCLEGVCQPVTVVQGTNEIAGVAIAGTDLYWTIESGPVMHCTVDCDGGAGQGFANVTAAGPIAVDATNVYWATSDGVQVCDRETCASVRTLASGGGQPSALALDDTNVYWTDPSTNLVVKCPIAAGAPLTIASGEETPQAVATDGSGIYWVDQGSGANGGARECSVSGCGSSGPASISGNQASNGPGGEAIVVTAGTVYWSTLASSPSIVACPAGTGCSGAPATFTSLSGNSTAFLLSDGSFLFWTHAVAANTSIYECTLSASCTSPKTLADMTGVSGMSLDAQSVYWASGQSIMRVAK